MSFFGRKDRIWNIEPIEEEIEDLAESMDAVVEADDTHQFIGTHLALVILLFYSATIETNQVLCYYVYNLNAVSSFGSLWVSRGWFSDHRVSEKAGINHPGLFTDAAVAKPTP